MCLTDISIEQGTYCYENGTITWSVGTLTEGDTVQNIIRKLIDYAKVSGIIVANADSYYTQGAIALSKGENLRALEWFILAYKQLQNKDMCAVPCPTNPCK